MKRIIAWFRRLIEVIFAYPEIDDVYPSMDDEGWPASEDEE